VNTKTLFVFIRVHLRLSAAFAVPHQTIGRTPADHRPILPRHARAMPVPSASHRVAITFDPRSAWLRSAKFNPVLLSHLDQLFRELPARPTVPSQNRLWLFGFARELSLVT
jgi:hypothetical protein